MCVLIVFLGRRYRGQVVAFADYECDGPMSADTARLAHQQQRERSPGAVEGRGRGRAEAPPSRALLCRTCAQQLGGTLVVSACISSATTIKRDDMHTGRFREFEIV